MLGLLHNRTDAWKDRMGYYQEWAKRVVPNLIVNSNPNNNSDAAQLDVDNFTLDDFILFELKVRNPAHSELT